MRVKSISSLNMEGLIECDTHTNHPHWLESSQTPLWRGNTECGVLGGGIQGLGEMTFY